jgi:hypothetical protein
VISLLYLLTPKAYLEVSDTYESLRTAQSIATRGRLDIVHAEGRASVGRDGKEYSKYGVGPPLTFAPVVIVLVFDRLSGRTGLQVEDSAGSSRGWLSSSARRRLMLLS